MANADNGFVIEHDALIDLIRVAAGNGATISFRARGPSMSPFIRDNDLLTVSPVIESDVKVGDVLAFVHPTTGGLIVHRIIKRDGNNFVMRGDSRFDEDGAFPTACLLGRVTGIRRGGMDVHFGLGLERYLIAFLSKTGILAYLIRLAQLLGRAGKKRAAH